MLSRHYWLSRLRGLGLLFKVGGDADQGSQFTSAVFTGVLLDNAIAISMDGKGAWRGNVFVEPREHLKKDAR